tara:strand:- start:1188 stop:2159 length:972 start_codon:yes stop_codon:yes gene_type:complete
MKVSREQQIRTLKKSIKNEWYPDKLFKKYSLLDILLMEEQSAKTIQRYVRGYLVRRPVIKIVKSFSSSLHEKLHTGSSIAKSGFKEEELICKYLNENDICEILKNLNVPNRDKQVFKVIKGTSKVDVSDGVTKLQIKKYTRSAPPGQLDRHWTSDVIKVIPALEPIKPFLFGLCEKALCENDKNKCSKIKPVIKLCNSIYSEDELSLFIKTLNKNKKDLLDYVFLGTDKTTTPEFIIGVQYIGDNRDNITIYNISDVINILMKEDFEIRKSKTVFGLGKSLSFQRKGGDKGKKSANQLQCKFSFQTFRESYDSKITNKATINL